MATEPPPASQTRIRAAEMETARRLVEHSPLYATETILAHYARMATTAAAALHVLRSRSFHCGQDNDPGRELINHCLSVIREDHAHTLGVEPAWPQFLLSGKER